MHNYEDLVRKTKPKQQEKREDKNIDFFAPKTLKSEALEKENLRLSPKKIPRNSSPTTIAC